MGGKTFWGGLRVPKTIVEHFTSTTTIGMVDLTLKYPYDNIENVAVTIHPDPASLETWRIWNITASTADNIIRVYAKKLEYVKPTAINTTDAAGGGAVAEPHNHTLSGLTAYDLGMDTNNATSLNFRVVYQPARGGV